MSFIDKKTEDTFKSLAEHRDSIYETIEHLRDESNNKTETNKRPVSTAGFMDFETAVRTCHIRSAIYRNAQPLVRYWKNHPETIESRVPNPDKLATDWMEYDPRDDDNGSLFMFND